VLHLTPELRKHFNTLGLHHSAKCEQERDPSHHTHTPYRAGFPELKSAGLTTPLSKCSFRKASSLPRALSGWLSQASGTTVSQPATLPVHRDSYRGRLRLHNQGCDQHDSRRTEVSAKLPPLSAKAVAIKREQLVTHTLSEP